MGEKMEGKKLTRKERDRIVLNTYKTKFDEGMRFFIFDCNKGVLDPEFNERLRNFLQDAIKNYEIDGIKLYKVILRANYNKSLPERIEYIRCKNKEILKESMISACSAITSEYYGYTDVHIKEVDMASFPEIIEAKIKCK